MAGQGSSYKYGLFSNHNCHATTECVNPVAHNLFQCDKHLVASAVAGVKMCIGIALNQSVGHISKRLFGLMVIKQMEPAHNRLTG